MMIRQEQGWLDDHDFSFVFFFSLFHSRSTLVHSLQQPHVYARRVI
jgi:hypothetical protein